MQKLPRVRGVRGAADWCAVGVLCYYAANTLLRAGISFLMSLRVPGSSLADPIGYTQTTAGLLSLLAGACALAIPVVFLLCVTRLQPASLRVLWPGEWSPWFCLALFLGLANAANLVGAVLNHLTGRESPITVLPAGGAALAVAFVLHCVLPALGEEILFRGALQGLLHPCGSGPAILAPALLFALLHQDPAQCLTAFCCGLFLGWLAERTGSILPGMLLHFVNNGIAFLNLYVHRYAPQNLSAVVQTGILLIFPLLAVLVLWRARQQGFQFKEGMQTGPRVIEIFKAPVYTITVILLAVNLVAAQMRGAA